MLGEQLMYMGSMSHYNCSPPIWPKFSRWVGFVVVFIVILLLFHNLAFAVGSIPGVDASDKLEAAGTLLRILDSVLFSWGARIFAGLCIMSAGWNFKEQRFGIAVLCVVAAIILGTAPTWVKNIFDIGGGGGIFSQTSLIPIKGIKHA